MTPTGNTHGPSIIERLESLTSACRECDEAISLLVRGFGFDTELRQLYGPAYTASLDCALSLVPEGWWLAGLCFHPVDFRSSHDCAWGAELGGSIKWVTYDGYPEPEYSIANGQSATPAIALCIAALKARNIS